MPLFENYSSGCYTVGETPPRYRIEVRAPGAFGMSTGVKGFGLKTRERNDLIFLFSVSRDLISIITHMQRVRHDFQGKL